ncbi:putative zinc transporter [Trypanosoma cruzi]|uniref:Putative zinc transporter n=1 Tax=Trypanosoma cruzi TaxID=5693 RepID=A0A2V2VR63_TRYCR|nr:putative zinc transporter [Trypanosoma cruzi]
MQSEVELLLRSGGAAKADYDTTGLRPQGLCPTPVERAAIEKVLSATEERRKRESKFLYGALIFCFVFMIVEFACGVFAHSLALLTDASHLLIDVGAYALSIMSLKAASRALCGKYNYGWHRAEVIGTLVSVFSIWALVVWIVIEGMTRTWNVVSCSRMPAAVAAIKQQRGGSGGEVVADAVLASSRRCEEINSPIMMLIGVLGMLVNIVCAAILYCGGSHGHSHFGGHGHSHSHGEVTNCESDLEISINGHTKDHSGHHHTNDDDDCGHGNSDEKEGHDYDHNHVEKKKSKKGFALHAALLHALGDCVQSAGVIFAGVFIYFANKHAFGVPSYQYSIYNIADPLCSLFFAVVTLNMTRPLLGDLFGILMESTPPGIDYLALNQALLSIEGVVSVHDLHIWSLSSDYVALSVHLVADDAAKALRKAQYVCEVLFGIRHTTIQVDAVANGADLCQGSCASPNCGKEYQTIT